MTDHIERVNMPLLRNIAAYCATNGISKTQFGLDAVNDGALVGRLERGRDIRVSMMLKIEDFLEAKGR